MHRRQRTGRRQYKTFALLLSSQLILAATLLSIVLLWKGGTDERRYIFHIYISEYGVGDAYIPFALGFSLSAILTAACFYLHGERYKREQKRGYFAMVFCSILAAVGAVVMGWSNTFYNQKIHYPAVLIGVACLELATIIHTWLFYNHFHESIKRSVKIAIICYYVATIFVFFGLAISWVINPAVKEASVFEWITAFTLASYFLPWYYELLIISENSQICLGDNNFNSNTGNNKGPIHI